MVAMSLPYGSVAETYCMHAKSILRCRPLANGHPLCVTEDGGSCRGAWPVSERLLSEVRLSSCIDMKYASPL
ncbi:hypothetical protein PsYK624_143910 [Phanerochaete sordida]|uniref:Uncharacterized protein n=1 Tax=Phanerochaete sordida TaxID=48140 RepID=A0A9P3LL00_9APHY|nr:hypothetical protein PsYK624_143910 [Phanerochaete sordida]